MQINWSEFTPIASLAGGLLIGLAASIMLLLNGRVTGISGIIRQTFFAAQKEIAGGLSFIIGLLLSPTLYFALYPSIQIQITEHIPLLITAGLLVGYGTAKGAGCTSGHGVCGLSRLSRRSFVAVVLFMLSAMLTVFIVRHF